MMTSAQLLYSSIDDYLGPAETRFFGHGYRRAEYRVGDIVARPEAAARVGPVVRATVSVAYPRDWSRKAAQVDLRPHLSTVDMLVLGVQFSEVHLAHAYGLDATSRQSAWLRRVTIRAGAKPQEDLAGLSGTAALRGTKAVPGSPNRFRSVYDCQVGEMQARCEIEHDIADRAAGEGCYDSIEDILGPATSRYYGEGFKFSQQHITDLNVDMKSLQASARVRITPTEVGRTATEGLEGRYQPVLSMIDCFVTNLQLSQVLMYEMDSVRRLDSKTLWMLRTVLDASRPDRPCAAALEAHASISEKRLLPLRGTTWRNVDVIGHCGGVNLRSSLAHELPIETATNEGSRTT
jgi:hypothetical protein